MTNDPRLTTTLWSGRFDTAPDAAAFEFGASFRFDRRLFEEEGVDVPGRNLGQFGAEACTGFGRHEWIGVAN